MRQNLKTQFGTYEVEDAYYTENGILHVYVSVENGHCSDSTSYNMLVGGDHELRSALPCEVEDESYMRWTLKTPFGTYEVENAHYAENGILYVTVIFEHIESFRISPFPYSMSVGGVHELRPSFPLEKERGPRERELEAPPWHDEDLEH